MLTCTKWADTSVFLFALSAAPYFFMLFGIRKIHKKSLNNVSRLFSKRM